MVKVIVLSGYGLNCEEEEAFAFEKAGASADIVHINDLISKKKKLSDYNILVFPGGFSYGDDTGAGKAFANRVRDQFFDDVLKFISDGKLVIGFCNGFQIMANLGLLPALNGKYGGRQVALLHNSTARYQNRWADLKAFGNSPWLKNIKGFSCPIAHGEGRFFADSKTLKEIKDKNMIALKYVKGEICEYQNLEYNPNGSLEDIAGITDETGRVLGMMPHPERALFPEQLPNWSLEKEKAKRNGNKLPLEGPGLQIFKNGVEFFRK